MAKIPSLKKHVKSHFGEPLDRDFQERIFHVINSIFVYRLRVNRKILSD